MALLPIFYNELEGMFGNRGRNLHPFCDSHGFYGPRALQRLTSQGDTSIHRDKDTFEVTLDVQHFTPEELTVKTVDNNYIIVEGKHEEKQDDHGYISRHFVRKYKLPEDHDAAEIASNLSSDGVLTIVSKKHKMLEANEKHVPIMLTGPSKPALTSGKKKEAEPKRN